MGLPRMPKSGLCSFLDIINDGDNVRLERTPGSTLLVDTNYNSEPLVPWCITTQTSCGRATIGLLRPAIVAQLGKENEIRRGLGLAEAWDIIGDEPSDFNSGTTRTSNALNITFKPWVDTPAKRTEVMKELCERWRDTALFADVCGPKKWRGEMYPVYAQPFGIHDYPFGDHSAGNLSETNFVFEMERSACALFGVVTYNVNMTIFGESENSVPKTMVWIPKRSRTKQTWPGYLDSSVAGGITSGMTPFESIVKESMEEASIEDAIVRKHAKSVGAISYFLRTSNGWLQPEVQYVYDLRIPPGADPAPFQPKPLDGEVEFFKFLPLDKVITKMRSRSFKTNCALVIVDFLIRHGHLTIEDEPDLMEILTRLHRRFDYTKW